MKIKTLAIAAILLGFATGARADAPPKEQQELACAAQRMQLFYYYLAPNPSDKVKESKLNCGGAEETVRMPDWLAKSAEDMRANVVAYDAALGKLNQADVWQTAVSLLYEFATTETTPGEERTGKYFGLRGRFNSAVRRIEGKAADKTFEGRGKEMASQLNRILESMDGTLDALTKDNEEAFHQSAQKTAELCSGLFAVLFTKADTKSPAYRYLPKPRVLPFSRGVTLEVPWHQAMFINAGDAVDLLSTFESVMEDGSTETVTATVLQKISVSGVRRGNDGETACVLLLCNPEEAQFAALAADQSKTVNLLRRKKGDDEMTPMPMATLRKMFK